MDSLAIFVMAVLLGCVPISISAQGLSADNYACLKWRSVGPARGGRSVAVTGVPARPSEFYFGATGGGLWKTTDAGHSWSCVSDGSFRTSSVGAVAVSYSKPDVVYAGMGERDIRGDISYGDGIYKSVDGGKTWRHMGLDDTQNVSRIIVDPVNPDIVYVAALGHAYGPNRDRGVYKSQDGGATWKRVLFRSDRAGAVDLVMDPAHPATLYAATWEASRTPYSLNSGGPDSGLYKTIDGGDTWTDISHNKGLPAGMLGKIGLALSPASPNRVWAIVEASESGLFRSDDGGATWQRVSTDHRLIQRPFYFMHVYADPKLADTIYVTNVDLLRSTNGGKSWAGMPVPHGDNHDLWIDPVAPDRMIEANDGGATVTVDGGKSWTPETYPTGEFYHVTSDTAFPYRIYGAQQDNSTVVLCPDGRPDPFARENWSYSAGGESGYMAVKPNDPDIVFGGSYGGVVVMLNERTGISRRIDPWPDNPMGHGAADLAQRFQWTFPIVTSASDPDAVYATSQYVFRTTDSGENWKRISPDLTRNDPSTMAPSGGPLTRDNTSVEYYGTVFTLAVSPVRRSVIWAGSDDGLVHVTVDGGQTWRNVTPTGLPKWARCSMIDASPRDPATAYLAANNYQNEDMAPYIFRTHDYGRTWTSITSGIQPGAFARVCRADPVRQGLLFAGTETGAYVSFDDGNHWQSLQLGLPVCPVHDLIVTHDNLIAATHGRGFWVLDDITLLRQLGAAAQPRPLLFQPKNPVDVRTPEVTIDYYLPVRAKAVRFEFVDPEGATITTYVSPKQVSCDPGVHRFTAALARPGFHTFPGMILWSGSSRPIPGPPGRYAIRMTVDGTSVAGSFRVVRDPRVDATERDLQEQYSFSIRVADRVSAANDAVTHIRDIDNRVTAAATAVRSDAGIATTATALRRDLDAIQDAIYQGKSSAGEDPLNYPIMLNDRLAGVLSAVQSGRMRPTQQARQVFEGLSQLLQAQLDRLKRVLDVELVAFNKQLAARGIAAVQGPSAPGEVSGSSTSKHARHPPRSVKLSTRFLVLDAGTDTDGNR